MRKCDAKCLLVHSRVELDEGFAANYVAVHDELEHLAETFPGSASTVTQVTFFSTDSPRKQQRLPPRLRDDHVLGTCIIIHLNLPKQRSRSHRAVSFLYESVLGFPSALFAGQRKNLINNYYHIGGNAEIWVAGRPFSLEAAYFCQQNGLTSVCAHSSIKTALWHLEEGRYQPSTRDINAIVRRSRLRSGNPRRASISPERGLWLEDIEAICKEYGTQTFVLDCRKQRDISPYEFAYLLVESGIPTILAFAPSARSHVYHMMPILGHTMNSDEWFPLAINYFTDLPPRGLRAGNLQYMSTAEWAAHLIVHDDLLGPYLCIDADALTREKRTDVPPIGRIRYVIGVIPQKANIPCTPYVVQQVAAWYFWGEWDRVLRYVCPPWKDRLQAQLTSPKDSARRLVLRTQLVPRGQYLAHLTTARDHFGNAANMSERSLMHLKRRLQHHKRLWMTEFSLPELHSTNRTKLGEILLPLDVTSEETVVDKPFLPPPIGFRAINYMDLYNGSPISLGLRSHIGIFRRDAVGTEF